MEKITYNFTLDLKKTESEHIIPVKEGDAKSRVLKIKLRSGALPYLIADGVTVLLYGAGTSNLFLDCAVEDNTVVCELPSDITELPLTLCELRLIGADGGVLSSPSFRIVSKETVYSDDAVEGQDNYSGLAAMIAEAQGTKISETEVVNGELIITYLNGYSINVGQVKGERGERGERGETGAAGAPGTDGVDGSRWHYGTAITGSGESIMMPVRGAVAGDYYLNTQTGETYVAVTGGEWWKYIGTLKGAKGDRGETGAQGIQGIQGEKGEQGIQGVQGVPGERGEQGIQGIQGERGPAGKAGFIASAEQPDAVDVLWLDTDDADEEDEGYTKAEVDAMFGEYITEVDALIGGED